MNYPNWMRYVPGLVTLYTRYFLLAQHLADIILKQENGLVLLYEQQGVTLTSSYWPMHGVRTAVVVLDTQGPYWWFTRLRWRLMQQVADQLKARSTARVLVYVTYPNKGTCVALNGPLTQPEV